ncbi:MAG: IS5 family transposase [Thermosynechococcaceae cyanobacterium]
MNYETSQTLKLLDFKRYVGVQRSTFKRMLKALDEQRLLAPRAGRIPTLSLAAQLLVALQYWREYRTYFHIAIDWKLSKSTICRIVHKALAQLMASGVFRLAGKKTLVRGFERPTVVVIDVTESPIERPKRRQRHYYSGKKKCHTLKCQVLINQDSGAIICLYFGKGRRHDFQLFKASGIHIHPETESLQDSGYQGIDKYHRNSYVPRKKPQQGELTSLEKDYNRQLSRERIGVEHVNGRLKVFKILAQRYRNRRRRYGLRCNLIAALYNDELAGAT